MQGLQEATESQFKYIDIKYGSLCEVSKEPVEGFKKVSVINPRTGETVIKYVKFYKAVDAMVCKIEWRDTEQTYNERYQDWKITLNAAGVAVMLTIPFKSRVGSRFMNVAENLDFTKPVRISAWKDSDEKTAISFQQDGENVPQKYTKENRHGCPEPTKTVSGWNFDAVNDYLHRRMMEVVIPAVERAGNVLPDAPQEAGLQPAEETLVEEGPHDDDIPF